MKASEGSSRPQLTLRRKWARGPVSFVLMLTEISQNHSVKMTLRGMCKTHPQHKEEGNRCSSGRAFVHAS